MLGVVARWRLLLLPGLLAVVAFGLLNAHPFSYDDRRLGSLLYGVLFTAGYPLLFAAQVLIRWLGPEHSAWTWPLAIPLGLLPYVVADQIVRRMAAVRQPAPRGDEPSGR
jgi:hypothetical protein